MEICMEPYEGREPFIFFSYCRKNSDLAYPLINALLRSGCRVWYDQGIRTGADWPEYIGEKLEQCSGFVVLLTAESEESTNCKNELTLAYRLEKPMVSMKTDSLVLDFGTMLNLGEHVPLIVEEYSREQLVQKLLTMPELKPALGAAKPPVPNPEDQAKAEAEAKAKAKAKAEAEAKAKAEAEAKAKAEAEAKAKAEAEAKAKAEAEAKAKAEAEAKAKAEAEAKAKAEAEAKAKAEAEAKAKAEAEAKAKTEAEAKSRSAVRSELESGSISLSEQISVLESRMKQPRIEECRAVMAEAEQPRKELEGELLRLREQLALLERQEKRLNALTEAAAAFLEEKRKESSERLSQLEADYIRLQQEAENADRYHLQPYMDALEQLAKDAEAVQGVLQELGESDEQAKTLIREVRNEVNKLDAWGKTQRESSERLSKLTGKYKRLQQEAENADRAQLQPYIDELVQLVKEAQDIPEEPGECDEGVKALIREVRKEIEKLKDFLDKTRKESDDSTIREDPDPLPLRIIRLSTGECWTKAGRTLRIGYGEGYDISLSGSGTEALTLEFGKGGYFTQENKPKNPGVVMLGTEPIYLAWGSKKISTDGDGLRWLYAPDFDEYLILPSGDTLIGRNGGWNGKALAHETISYNHLLVHCMGKGSGCTVSVEDHGRNGGGSTNGTKINEKRIQPKNAVTVYDGDRITLGTRNILLEYHCHIVSGGFEL